MRCICVDKENNFTVNLSHCSYILATASVNLRSHIMPLLHNRKLIYSLVSQSEYHHYDWLLWFATANPKHT